LSAHFWRWIDRLPLTCGASAARDACHRQRLAHARLGGGEARIAGLRGVEPRVELRIVIGAPPVGGRPLRVAVGRADRIARVERGRLDHVVLRGDASSTCTAGDC
jgi:hypothetical protein